MQNRLSHINEQNQPKMVDVSAKNRTMRTAAASGRILLCEDARAQIKQNRTKKGNVCVTAELAGVMAAKRTSELIPLCHPLPLTHVDVNARLTDEGVTVTATVRCVGQTGVEMEALTAVSTALLTVYDMCKAVDKSMVIEQIELIEKTKLQVNQD
ncbi:MAG: cyclic pyranopterin monophosphate synthase MoaC [Deltaproteobacteria bacterium]|nr:cyclic pyranopterin monophosphate synthase MoaC [Deltaproteobacteria bacterium]